ncbi:MAG TPA: MBL fold metallo-hydrolase [Anaerolineae bacterium]|nr:MBL fold metallo-hydrolase [Anaerolineae bacterium]
MEITWLGHSCFRLRSRAATVVTDPYGKDLGLTLPRVRADIVTVSHAADDHDYVKGVKGDFKVLSGPGEYEVSGAFITGLVLGERKTGGKSSKSGATATDRNTVFLVELDGLTVCHLGDLNTVPTQAMMEESLSEVDVLLVPVGGGESLNASQAAEVVSLLEPHIVIPMHYKFRGSDLKLDPVSKFLKEMGLDKVEEQEMLKLDRSGLPDETQVVLLELKSKDE